MMSNDRRISRRTLLSAGGAVGAAALAGRVGGLSQPALAAEEEKRFFFPYRGGINGDAEREFLVEPFGKANGITIKASAFPSAGQIKAMVESKTVDFDVYDVGPQVIASLVQRDLLQPIDYSLLPATIKEDLMPGCTTKWGVGAYTAGLGIVYNNKAFTEQNHPRTWAEFWDVKKFPGARTMPTPEATSLMSPLEAALLADGVPADKMFPLDIDRAFRKLDQIRPHIVKFWIGTSDGFDMMMQGNADLAALNFGRIIASKINGEAKDLSIERNQAFAKPTLWVIPKGAPHPQNAHKFIAFSADPKNQAAFLNGYPAYGTVNPKALQYIEPKNLQYMINAPGTEALFLPDEWWMAPHSAGKTNYDHVVQRWAAWQ